MLESLKDVHPVLLAFIATCFTWSVTALGAATVFFFREINRRVLDAMLGFAAGVMIAASFWSLLAPGIRMAEELRQTAWLTAAIGFLSGGAFLWLIDKFLPHLHLETRIEEAEGIHTTWSRSVLLVLAITLHNIPEGMAVGVSFGALAVNLPGASLAGAVALAIGIGLQNFPEGAAVSIPLRRDGFSRWKSFWYGQMSAVVEPIAAVIGAISVIHIQPLLPYAMAFAAGAMIYVVVEELIPESQQHKDTHFSTVGCLAGFTIMMMLDVALG